MNATATRTRAGTRSCHRPRIPTDAELLRRDIAAVCDQIDRRRGNPAGTAERAVWWWYGPPYPEFDNVPVLTRLHADAVAFLLDTLTNPKERP